MYRASQDSLNGGRVCRYELRSGETRLGYADVLELWQSDEQFREFFLCLLRESCYAAFRWETPPITSSTRDRLFEFVLVESPGLARAAQREAFAEHFPTAAATDVVCFDNLGGDAGLVVPCPQAEDSAYVHLASFVRNAPHAQQHALWQTVGRSVQERLSDRPLWLSTAGGGVAWLHVRLDSRPKYYSYAPFRAVS
jgi:hypothetical protein